MVQINLDSTRLNRVFSTFKNSDTGVGTSRDKSLNNRIGYNHRLEEYELEQLYKDSGVIRRLVDCYPNECQRDWIQLKVTDGSDIDTNLITDYFKAFKDKKGRKSLRQAFTIASKLARKHGDAFIILGVADGQNPSEPIDYNRIQSIEWLKVLSRYEVYPDRTGDYTRSYEEPEYYKIWSQGGDVTWHWSRVLRFTGHQSLSNYDNDGYNDSVIQSCYQAFQSWLVGMMSSSAMLADYSQGVYKMKGLGQGLLNDLRSGSNEFQNQVVNRLFTAEMGRSIVKAVLIDMDDEDFGYEHRNYSGADSIMDRLKEGLIANADLPSYKLFNVTNATSNALSTNQTAGLAQRYDWNAHKNNWITDNWIDNYERVSKIALNSQELELNPDTKISILPNAQVELTTLELLEAQNQARQRDESNIASGVYTRLTAQNAYKGDRWNHEIQLDERDIADEPLDGDDDDNNVKGEGRR